MPLNNPNLSEFGLRYARDTRRYSAKANKTLRATGTPVPPGFFGEIEEEEVCGTADRPEDHRASLRLEQRFDQIRKLLSGTDEAYLVRMNFGAAGRKLAADLAAHRRFLLRLHFDELAHDAGLIWTAKRELAELQHGWNMESLVSWRRMMLYTFPAARVLVFLHGRGRGATEFADRRLVDLLQSMEAIMNSAVVETLEYLPHS